MTRQVKQNLISELAAGSLSYGLSPPDMTNDSRSLYLPPGTTMTNKGAFTFCPRHDKPGTEEAFISPHKREEAFPRQLVTLYPAKTIAGTDDMERQDTNNILFTLIRN